MKEIFLVKMCTEIHTGIISSVYLSEHGRILEFDTYKNASDFIEHGIKTHDHTGKNLMYQIDKYFKPI